MKYIYFIILIVFLFLKQDNVYALTDIEAAKAIYEEIYGTSPDYDPCSATSQLYQCGQDSNGNKYILAQYFQVYDLPSNDPITFTTDFSPFTKVNKTVVVDPFRLGDSFYNNVNKLVSLKTLDIQTQTSAISNSVVFPSSLYSISITNMGTKLSSPFFNGKIKLSIKTAITGYSIDLALSYCPQKTSLNFELPISNLGGLPINFFDCFPLPSSLRLNILNKKASIINPNSQVFTLPQFPANKTIYSSIYINFEANSSDEAIMFNFPESFGRLFRLEINGYGFQLDKNLGYIKLPQASTFTINNIGNSLFGECTKKPCIVQDLNSSFLTFKVSNANFNISNIDFSTITSFESKYNLLEQQLPSDINVTRLSSFSLAYSKVYGDIPYKYYLIRFLDLSYNAMNGTVPSPFLCESKDSLVRSRIVKGNNFSNYNSSTEPTCPNFKIFPITDNLLTLDTKGTNYVTIKGTDLGHDYSIFKNFSRAISILPVVNQQLDYYIDSGGGKNHQVTLYFQPAFPFSFSFTYSYADPIIRGYRVSGSQIQLIGSGFNYKDNNEITCNGISTYGAPAYNNVTRFYYLNAGLTEGKSFNISINVGGSISNVKFIFYPLSVYFDYTKIYKIYSSGGEVTLIMDNYTIKLLKPNSKTLSFYIGNDQQTILSIQDNGIRVKYEKNDYYTKESYERPALYIFDSLSGLYIDNFTPEFIDDQWNSSDDSDNVSFANSISINFNLLSLLLFSLVLFLLN